MLTLAVQVADPVLARSVMQRGSERAPPLPTFSSSQEDLAHDHAGVSATRLQLFQSCDRLLRI